MKNLLVLTAVFESATGLALLLAPALPASLLSGVALWPAVATHVALAFWCITIFRRSRGRLP